MANSKTRKKDNEGQSETKSTAEKVRIVAIGASAGGLEPINTFFDNLPKRSTGLAFVVVQHLSPDYKSLMPELLARHTKLKINTIENNMLVEKNNIYLIPANKKILIANGAFITQERGDPKMLTFPINIFFKSLAEEMKESAIAIILSGSGSDGSIGIESIKEKGGMAMVQDEATASFDSMPRSAMSTGMVDFILPPEEMPARLMSYIKHPYSSGQSIIQMEQMTDEKLVNAILKLVNKKRNIDFENYKKTTIVRRIQRRMGVKNFLKLSDYYDFLSSNPNEVKLLSGEFLIGVTSFFRDTKAFEYLQKFVIPKVIDNTAEKEHIRVWSVGCSTGEEAYSIAILFKEHFAKSKQNKKIKIFATDIDERAIEEISKGFFRDTIEDSLSKERLANFFTKTEKGYTVKKSLRDMIVFAKHDIIKDPPFNNIDLISCRNMLIYLNNSLQEKVFTFFGFSLNKDGFLFLGSSETLSQNMTNFRLIHRTYKVYQKMAATKVAEIANLYDPRVYSYSKPADENYNQLSNPTAYTDSKVISHFKDALLEDVIPASVIVNELGDVIHVAGPVEKILRLPKKQFNLNILKMVPDSLYVPLSTILTRIKKEKKKVIYHNISVDIGESKLLIDLIARTFLESISRTRYTIITFQELPSKEGESGKAFNTNKQKDVHIKQIEDELKDTKDFLQSTVEELETSNEELQATNEELIAANEELQSTNEELQSVNEELFSVNNEFQSKIAEMSEVNDDANNLLQSIEIGTIFIDKEMGIRKFTDAAQSQIYITERDIGRSIEEFSSKLIDVDLAELSGQVLESLNPIEQQVATKNNDNYLMRILPYRTNLDEVKGIVITFVNINQLKHTQEQLLEQTERLKQTNDELEQFAYVASHDLQEPLRMVTSYVELLKEDYQDKLHKEADEYIGFITDGASRMKHLIDDLLTFSRLGRFLNIKELNMNEVLEVTLSNLDTTIKETDAQVISENLPAIKADMTEMTQLMQNIIGNAIKFRKDNTPPIVIVKAESEKNNWLFSVKDNGIGIDAEYANKVFIIFNQLEGKYKQKGTGIGLAIAKRIVERQNGKIWFESKANEGTTFFFTFPKKSAHS